MPSVRVHELAKRLGIPSKELVARLQAEGIPVKNHMSVVDSETADIVLAVLRPEEPAKPARKAKAPRSAQAPAQAPAKARPGRKAEGAPVQEAEPSAKPSAKPKPSKSVARTRRAPEPRQEAAAPERGAGKPRTTRAPAARPRRPKPKVSGAAAEEVAARPLAPVIDLEEAKEKVARAPQESPTAVAEPQVERPPAEAEKPPEPLVHVEEVKKVSLGEAVTVKELADKLGVSPSDVLKKFLEMGIVSAINQIVDIEAAIHICKKFGYEARVALTKEGDYVGIEEDEESELRDRAPVVTVMGHVDHGKTSLLDAIRETRVMETEAGGITQHIGAYVVERMGRRVVFVDTPGHEAFTAMRARGAQVTDVVVLVVAADDGVMPQTLEAIDHARAANVPIMVAVNKIDKPNANPQRVREDLAKQGLVPEEWGGDTIYVDVSAKLRRGIDLLLEMILLRADVMELKANPRRLARGTVIESRLDRGRGPVATVLVQNGTLRVGDAIVAGLHFGRIRALISDRGTKLPESPPSTPVEVLGLSGLPLAGDSFMVVDEEWKARQLGEIRLKRQREERLIKASRVSLDELYRRIREGEIRELGIVVRADTQGSVQAVSEALERLSTDKVRLRVLHGSAGAVRETDVSLAMASNAIIIGFNVRPTPQAQDMAAREGVDIRLYRVIYEVIDDMKAAMEGMLEPQYEEVILGRAEVRRLFSIPRVGVVAGCYVNEGVVRRGADVRVVRDGVVVYEGKIGSLRRFKDDVREVAAGYECGLGVERFNDLKEGDVIELFEERLVESKA